MTFSGYFELFFENLRKLEDWVKNWAIRQDDEEIRKSTEKALESIGAGLRPNLSTQALQIIQRSAKPKSKKRPP